MSVKAASPGPIFWVLSGILCACTLAALLVTAIQVKNRKMAARYGERLDTPPAPEAPLTDELLLHRGRPTSFQHFHLELPANSDALEVHDARDRTLVRFTGVHKGDERGWQELRIRVLDVQKDEIRVAPEFRPGAPCFGAGTYLELRTGLRIDFPQGRSATLVAWDPAKPEARVKVEAADRAEEQTLGEGERRGLLGLTFELHQGQLSVTD
jgi:hypothetical protein